MEDQIIIQLIPMMVGLPLIGFWMWMFREMTTNPALTQTEKRTWMLEFFLMNIIAAALYYANIYKKRD